MPSPEDNDRVAGEAGTASQPFPLSDAHPGSLPKTFLQTFFTKMAIATRLLGKEIYRTKLRFFDLRRADRRLGEKAYASGKFPELIPLSSQIDHLRDRIASLSQKDTKVLSRLGEQAKGISKRAVRKAQTALLEAKRKRIVRKMGVAIREAPAHVELATERETTCALVEKIDSVQADISNLAPQTYFWSRRPLLLSAILLVLTMIGITWMAKVRMDARSESNSRSSGLSDAQFKDIQAQTAAFSEQMLQMQADASRRESQATQERIAEAERTYKAQAEREQIEQEEAARAEAQKEEQASREEAEREKQEAQLAAAEQARLEREQAHANKLAQEKVERERAEAERAATAERARKEEEQRAARLVEDKRLREEDERAAQKTPASQLIAKSDVESIMGFAIQAPEDCKVEGILTRKGLSGVEEASSCFFASTLPKTDRSFKGVMVTVRYLRQTDEDQAQTLVRETMGKAEFVSPDLFFAHVPDLGYGGFFYRDFDNKASDSIFVFKPTLRGCTLLQVGIDGAPSEESSKDTRLWHQHIVDRETKIALKILGPPRVKVARYETRHPKKQEDTPKSYLPDIPGADPKVMRFFNGFLKRAADADAAHIAHSKSVVAESGGTKMLCPKCGGSKKMVRRDYNSTHNPYRWGTLPGALYENNRESVNVVNCDECGGTGVVNAR